MMCPSQRQTVAVSLFGLISFAMAFANQPSAQANEGTLSKVIISAYVRATFGATDKLEKPSYPVTIAFHCPKEDCNEDIKLFKDLFPKHAVYTKPTESAVINIVFGDSVEGNPALDFNVEAKWKLRSIKGDACSVASFSYKNVTQKVIVMVDKALDMRSKLACVLTETLRGTGLQLREQFPEYSKVYRSVDDSKFQRALLGFKNFLIIHWSKKLSAGMSKNEVEKQLLEF
jgi:hypothetical protein